MQRTLPALIAVVAVTLAAAGGAMSQPSPQPQSPAPPARSGQPPNGGPAGKPAGPPPKHQPNSLGADWRLQQDEVRQGVRRGRIIPLSRVIEQLNARSPGRQLDAGLEYQGDQPIYRVRWMTRDGRRVDYLINATTGAILSGG
jgi:hypothetical protein